MQNLPPALKPFADPLYAIIISALAQQSGKSTYHQLFYSEFSKNGGKNPIAYKTIQYGMAYIYAILCKNQTCDQQTLLNSAAQVGITMEMYEILVTNFAVRQYATQEQLNTALSPQANAELSQWNNEVNKLFSGQAMLQQAQPFAPIGSAAFSGNSMQQTALGFNQPVPQMPMFNTALNIGTGPTSLSQMGTTLVEETKPATQVQTKPQAAPQAMPTPEPTPVNNELKTFFSGSDMERSNHILTLGDVSFTVHDKTNTSFEMGVDLMKLVHSQGDKVRTNDDPSLSTEWVVGSLPEVIRKMAIDGMKRDSSVYRAFCGVESCVVTTMPVTDMLDALQKCSSIEALATEMSRLVRLAKELSNTTGMEKKVTSMLTALLALDQHLSVEVLEVAGIYRQELRSFNADWDLSAFSFSSDIMEYYKLLDENLGVKAPALNEKMAEVIEARVSECLWAAPQSSSGVYEKYCINAWSRPVLITYAAFNHVEFGYSPTADWQVISNTNHSRLVSLIRSGIKHIDQTDRPSVRTYIATNDRRLFEVATRWKNEYIIRDVSFLIS